jgi:hypothetical protein
MARDRMIRKKFWDDRKISRVSRDARLLFIGLWNLADDLGVLVADNLFIKSKVFPYDQIQLQQFGCWINELLANGFISQFSHKSEDFYYLPNFSKHQTINRPNFNDLLIAKPLLEGIIGHFTDQSVNNHGIFTDESLPNIREEEIEEEEKEKRKGRSPQNPVQLKTEKSEIYTPGAENSPPLVAAPPSSVGPPIEEVKRFFRGAGGTEEMAEKFWNKWDGVGWVDNGSRIVRWASRANNFITNYYEKEKKNGTSGANKQTMQPGGIAVPAGPRKFTKL